MLTICNGKWLLKAWAGPTCIGVFGQCREVAPESKHSCHTMSQLEGPAFLQDTLPSEPYHWEMAMLLLEPTPINPHTMRHNMM